MAQTIFNLKLIFIKKTKKNQLEKKFVRFRKLREKQDANFLKKN